MTHEHVTDFAQELVKMAMATTRVPELERELARLCNDFAASVDTIQRLELKAIDRNREISDLHARIRDLEVARDDAELRFLECDDAKSTLARIVAGIVREGQGVLEAIKPIEAVEAVFPHPTTAFETTGHPGNVDSQVTQSSPRGLVELESAGFSVSSDPTPTDATVPSPSAVSSDASATVGPDPEQIDDPRLPVFSGDPTNVEPQAEGQSEVDPTTGKDNTGANEAPTLFGSDRHEPGSVPLDPVSLPPR